MTAQVPFAKLLSHVVDNRGKTCPTTDKGLPLIATNCVKNTTLYPTFEKVRFVSEKTYSDWFRGHPQPNDMIFVTKGSPGQVCLTPDPVSFCIAQDMVAIRANSKAVYPPYLFAALRSSLVQEAIGNMHVGTLIPHFKKGDFDKLLIPLPDQRTQKFIGDTHLLFEKKIDLNHRMNETLEAMARAIFKDWFVDFGPTRAKMEGRSPYLTPELWALFPDRLDDYGKPAEWALGRLDDLFVLQRGFDLPADKRRPGAYAVMAASGENGYHDEFKVLGPGVTTGRSGVLGNVFFIHENFWPLNTSLWVNEYKYSTPLHAYFLLQHLEVDTFNAGSAVPTLNRNHIHSLPVSIPPQELLAEFDDLGMVLFKRKRANEKENNTLAAIRDLLLPKLMSGEIRIKEAEKIAEAAL